MKSMKHLFFIILFIFICSCILAQDKEIKKSGVLVKYIFSHEIIPLEKMDEIKFITIIPTDYKYRQKVKKVKYSIAPSGFYNKDNYKYAEFTLTNIDKKTNVTIECLIETYKYDLNTAMLLNTGKNYKLKENMTEFLKSEINIESNDKKITSVADQFKSDIKIDLVKQIFDFVLANLEYELLNFKSCGALYSLNNKICNCTGYSNLFIALCRAKGIPARTIGGYSIIGGLGHKWAEVYLDELGWVPFDPSESDNLSALSINFNNLTDNYVYTFVSINREFYDKYFDDLPYWKQGKIEYHYETVGYKM